MKEYIKKAHCKKMWICNKVNGMTQSSSNCVIYGKCQLWAPEFHYKNFNDKQGATGNICLHFLLKQ